MHKCVKSHKLVFLIENPQKRRVGALSMVLNSEHATRGGLVHPHDYLMKEDCSKTISKVVVALLWHCTRMKVISPRVLPRLFMTVANDLQIKAA